MGWNESEFWQSCPRTLFLAIDGFFELHNAKEKENWIRAQFIAYHSVLPYIPKGKHDQVRRKIFFFKEEEKSLPKRLSREEIKKRFSKWDKDHKKEYKAK